jgi:hypothetical protein
MTAATAAKERPILFSSAMIRAILDGRKRQTRRVIKGPVEFIGGKGDSRDDPTCWGWADEYGDYHTLAPDGQSSCDESCAIPCPYGRVGDRLWVRETWALVHFDVSDGECWGVDDWDGPIPKEQPPFYAPLYAADAGYSGEDAESRGFRWRPSIHMPRWASRITLEIAGVRVERLQGISEEDAWAEGFPDPEGRNREYPDRARYWFRHLWDSINGNRHPWESNPWVWAIEFKVLEKKGAQA